MFSLQKGKHFFQGEFYRSNSQIFSVKGGSCLTILHSERPKLHTLGLSECKKGLRVDPILEANKYRNVLKYCDT